MTQDVLEVIEVEHPRTHEVTVPPEPAKPAKVRVDKQRRGSASSTVYMPALDGLRAFSVMAVMAYHLGYGWASGGYLGVDMFFVLSGYLITGLLLDEWCQFGGIHLKAFWARRAKRLLPALFLLLAVLAGYAAFGGPGLNRSSLRPDSLATLFYVANWHQVFAHQSYFDQFLVPSPLRHTWSLAIEEQFYLFWPLILLVALGPAVVVGRRALERSRWRQRQPLHATRRAPEASLWGRREPLLVLTLGIAAVSALLMAFLYHPGADPTRAYNGTDTRAFELLLGAGLAVAIAGRRELPAVWQKILWAAGLVSAGLMAYAWVTASGPPGWMFTGGMFAGAILCAVIIASVTQRDPGPLGKVLSLRPLRWMGMISYGLYLWHWPVFVIVSHSTTGLRGTALDVLRVGLTFAIATASFYVIERPLRRVDYSSWRRRLLVPVGVAVTAAAVVFATVPTTRSISASASPANAINSAAKANPTARRSAASTSGAVVNPQLPPPPPEISLPPGRALSATDPLRVMAIGDSVMSDAEPGIAAALEANGVVKVTDKSFVGFGLLHTPTWKQDWSEAIASFHPEVVIGMWSWDNEQAQADPASYEVTLDEALGVLLAPGNGVDAVVFLQFPKVGERLVAPGVDPVALTAKLNAAQDAWNADVASRVAAWPGHVAYLPVASSLEIKGQYSAWLKDPGGNWVRARKIDNAHMCPFGAARFGAAVELALSGFLKLPPADLGWWNGPWATDPRYNDPPGACPNDQP